MMQIELTESEVKTLHFYLNKSLIDAEGAYAIGVGNKTSVENLKAIRRKINAQQNKRK